jgi:hypothetical protein
MKTLLVVLLAVEIIVIPHRSGKDLGNSENSKVNPINSVKSACGIWENICPVELRKIAKK